jgi:hypothetical protein
MHMLRRVGVITGLLAVAFFTLVASGAGSAKPRHCQAADFTLRQGPSSSALAHFRQTVRLRNTTHTTCQMSGWANVVLLNVHGKVLPSHEHRIRSDMFGTSPKPTVVVKPGGSASFAIDTTAPSTRCPTAKAIAVTPPGGHGKARLVIPVQACKHFSVLPVQPGNKAIHP